MSLLTITHASKAYNGVPALIDAALDLQSGEVHALMGENGAGKSTLIKLLAGVLAPDSMHIVVRGQPARIHSAQSAFDLGLRFIHQELNVVPQLSVAENIFLSQPYPTYAGAFVRWRRLNDRAQAILSEIGVTHVHPRDLMARLSPGDQMLVSIARAFAGDDLNNPALVYVMDEPTAALTGQEVDMLFRVIARLKQRGSAVLYVSHRMDEIFRIADRVTVMRDGRVVATRPIADTSPADLIRLMTGRELKQVYPPRETPPGSRVVLDVRALHTAAVRDISFQLAEGEILGVAGLIGSGRTELLRALMGADRLLGGEILLDGANIAPLSPASAWARGIAYVPEERRSQGLVLSRCVGDNITLPHVHRLSHAGVFLNHGGQRRISRETGESVRLKMVSPAQTTRQLSGGNQQKTVFARALVQPMSGRNGLPARVLLLDEPTRGVDVGAKYDLYALIRRISASGAGILMVSSDLPELLGMADRILVMRGGRLVENVPAAGHTEESLLSLCYALSGRFAGEITHDRAENP